MSRAVKFSNLFVGIMISMLFATFVSLSYSQPSPKLDSATKAKAAALIVNLKEKESRKSAAWALGRIGPASRDAIPTLVAGLKDQDKEFRISAAFGLFRIDPTNKDAIPTLIAAFETPYHHAKSAGALGEIGPAARDAIPALSKALKDEDWRVSDAAETALKKIKGRE